MLTSFAADNKVFPAIRAGAAGYLLQRLLPDDLVRAIRQVQRGEPVAPPGHRAQATARGRTPGRSWNPPPRRSRPRDAVLRLIAQGLSNQDIADQIAVSEATVRADVSRILAKLHLASRTQAALYAVHEGLTNADAASTQEG